MRLELQKSVISPSDNTLTISVVCYHTPLSMLERMLGTLISALKELLVSDSSWKFQILLIDNSEANELSLNSFASYSSQLQSISCELRLIKGQGNVGFGAGHNLSMSTNTNGFHLIMNPDVELHTDCLKEGVNHLRCNDNVAIASPAAKGGDGEKLFLCKRYPSIWVLFLRGFMPRRVQRLFSKQLDHYELRDLDDMIPCQEVPIVSGCFMLCRANALRQIAGFDEEYFLYFEDFDLSMRMSEQYSLVYVPSMQILHYGGQTSRKGFRHIGFFVKSAFRFFSIYGWRIF